MGDSGGSSEEQNADIYAYSKGCLHKVSIKLRTILGIGLETAPVTFCQKT
jgi:hypothetical protein